MINAYLIFLQDDCLFNNPTRCIKKNVVYKIIGGNFFFLNFKFMCPKNYHQRVLRVKISI